MTAANFPAEYADELIFEGGFVDDPQDPGGATDFGITLATLTHWRGTTCSVADLKALQDPEKRAIYRGIFWNPIQGDLLPSGLDLVVFDMAVNGGPSRAAKILQSLIGAVADGVIGPATLRAVAERGSIPGMILAYSSCRKDFYRGLSTFGRFGAGWFSRVDAAKTKALALVRTS